MTKVSKEQQELINDCVTLFERLHRGGLHATAQKMHEVVREVGYEVAHLIQKKRKVK